MPKTAKKRKNRYDVEIGEAQIIRPTHEIEIGEAQLLEPTEMQMDKARKKKKKRGGSVQITAFNPAARRMVSRKLESDA